MFAIIKRRFKKPRFNRKVLRKNDISLLILDERWNNLFKNIKKSASIEKCEGRLRELLMYQSRVIEELKNNNILKKRNMNRIMELTKEVFEENEEAARKEMQECEKEIKRINQRALEIEEELERIPELIKKANLELLEHTVNMVYFKIKKSRKRINKLEKRIEKTRKKLKAYLDEKKLHTENYTNVYSFYHDLLGREELEILDSEFLKN